MAFSSSSGAKGFWTKSSAAPVGNHDDRTGVAPLDTEPLEELVPVGAVEVEIQQAEEKVAVGKNGERFVDGAGHDRFISPSLQ